MLAGLFAGAALGMLLALPLMLWPTLAFRASDVLRRTGNGEGQGRAWRRVPRPPLRRPTQNRYVWFCAALSTAERLARSLGARDPASALEGQDAMVPYGAVRHQPTQMRGEPEASLVGLDAIKMIAGSMRERAAPRRG
jgi:hypothetical protein